MKRAFSSREPDSMSSRRGNPQKKLRPDRISREKEALEARLATREEKLMTLIHDRLAVEYEWRQSIVTSSHSIPARFCRSSFSHV